MLSYRALLIEHSFCSVNIESSISLKTYSTIDREGITDHAGIAPSSRLSELIAFVISLS